MASYDEAEITTVKSLDEAAARLRSSKTGQMYEHRE